LQVMRIVVFPGFTHHLPHLPFICPVLIINIIDIVQINPTIIYDKYFVINVSDQV
jgi:hypothetical protein